MKDIYLYLARVFLHFTQYAFILTFYYDFRVQYVTRANLSCLNFGNESLILLSNKHSHYIFDVLKECIIIFDQL